MTGENMTMASYEERMMEKAEEKRFLEQMRSILPEIFSIDDDELYRKLCVKNLHIDDTLEEILLKWGHYTKIGVPRNYPSMMWHIVFPVISTDTFYTELTSTLSISKIHPIFFIEHRFCLKNFDEERLTDVLENWSGYDYYNAQGVDVIKFHMEMEQYLNQKGYIKLPTNIMDVTAYTTKNRDVYFSIRDLLFTDKYTLWKKTLYKG